MQCPACSAEIKDPAAKFCAACGRTLPTTAAPPAAAGAGALAAPPAFGGAGEELLFDGRPAAIPSVGALILCILTVGIGALVYWLRALGTHYRVTTQRVVIERGFFSKRMEQIDLYRVVEYVVERPFGQRLLGTGNLVLEAMDKTTPEVRLDGVRTNVMALYERLRAATEAEKRRRGVRVFDVERP
jgi:hypothetical protein